MEKINQQNSPDISRKAFKRRTFKCLLGLSVIMLCCCLKVEAKNTLNWTGSVSSDWNTPQNWAPQIVPGGVDDVQIGIIPFNNQLTVTGIVQCGTITMGTRQAIVLTVSSTGNISVSGTITVAHSEDNLIPAVTIAGAGSITCSSLIVGNSVLSKLIISKTTELISTLANFTVTGNVFINSTDNYLLSGGFGHNSALFVLQAGVLTVGGQIKLTNLFPTYLSVLIFFFPPSEFRIDIGSGLNAKLKVSGSSAVNLYKPFWDAVYFYNVLSGGGSSTVEYAGANQIINTSSTPGVIAPSGTYDNLIISGTGVKNTESSSGDSLNITGFLNVRSTLDLQVNHAFVSVNGDFYNVNTTKLAKSSFYSANFTNKGTLASLTDTVEFLGSNQLLMDSTTNGTTLINTFLQTGIKTIKTGNYIVASGGNWTVANDSTSIGISPGAQLTFHVDNSGQSTMTFKSATPLPKVNKISSLRKLGLPSNISANRNLSHGGHLKKDISKPEKKRENSLKLYNRALGLRVSCPISGIDSGGVFVAPNLPEWYESNCFFYRTIHTFIS
jgi:trimeric autotransporter adhesin